jgi:hypothetical protein
VSVPDFLFALELSDRARAEAMVNDLAMAALQHAGYSPEAVEEIAGALRGALATVASAGAGRHTVQFSARLGTLLIAVSGTGIDWHTTRPLP